MDIIEQIGAYGGLAAVLGLAVLSALYFSQARDVKRLREWAGRAPERVAEGAAAEQIERGVVAQPQPKVVQEAQPGAPPVPSAKPATPGAKPATPAAKPVPAAAAAAAGAGPATADQKVAAGQKAAPAKPGVPVATPAAASAGAATAAPAKESTVDSPQSTEGKPPTPATATPGDGAPAAPEAPSPPKPPAPPAKPRPTVPLPSQKPRPSDTAIFPPRAEPGFFSRLLDSPRYLVLAIAGVLIVGGAAAFGVVQLTKDDEGGSTGADVSSGGGGGGGDTGGDEPKPAPVTPSEVTVSVLNGTTIPGLAASIGDKVEAQGFVLGNVDNSADQGARNESVVLFTDGAEREATAVGRRLGISQREPIDPTSQAIAGDASVVVIAGTDLTP